MFELLNDRRRTAIKWWTLPSLFLITLSLGVNIGILIGRRDWDFFQWAGVGLSAVIAWLIISPILREIKARVPSDDDHGD